MQPASKSEAAHANYANPNGRKQVKQVYNDQPLGILALGKIGGGYGSLVSVVSRVPGYLGGVLWYLG